MRTTHLAWLCAAITPMGCLLGEEPISIAGGQPSDVRPVVRAAKTPPPITGGTLLITRDGSFAVAADPDRDLIHVVNLATNKETATIELEPGANPFRGVEDQAGRVYITLRGTGEVVGIDPAAGEAKTIFPVCPNPRGIASVDANRSLAIACAGGELVRVTSHSGRVLDRDFIAPDLRDVFVDDGQLMVSRFRAAQVYAVDDSGSATLRGAPLSLSLKARLRAPNTAWRTVGAPDGGWLMLHQLANTEPLGLGATDSRQETIATSYVGAIDTIGPVRQPCVSAVQPSVSAMRPDGTVVHGPAVDGIALAVDAAVSPDGHTLVVASPSQHGAVVPREGDPGIALFTIDMRDFTGSGSVSCSFPEEIGPGDDFVAVAFDGRGNLYAQARAQPKLYRFDGIGSAEVIELAGADATDTGHDLFHKDAGFGLACVSCHPEGGDDGRVWSFAELGPRRTQPLNVGLEGTEPYHWGGDMLDMNDLVHEVRGLRMGGSAQTDARAEAMGDWLFSIPLPNPTRPSVDALAKQGEALFKARACDECHAGTSTTSNAFVDLGRGPLQIPSLHGAALRPPFMHDGRSMDLEAATRDMLTLSPDAPPASDEDVDAMVAYLQTL
ncbi:MAG: c-type cytochrome [Myxococcota bacterium]